MTQVRAAIATMSPNRIVYAEGSLNRGLCSAAALVVWSLIVFSSSDVSPGLGDGAGCGGGGVGPGLRAPRDLEPEEPVDDVEQRTEQVEEAVREVGAGGDAEHAR